MRLISLLLLTCVMSKSHSRRKHRNRKSRRKHHPRTKRPPLGSKDRDFRIHPITPFEENYFSRKHKMLTDIINSDMQFTNDEPFSANAFMNCTSPAPTCPEGETCRRIYLVSCEKGSCDQIPRQYCESTCIYECPNNQDMLSNMNANVNPNLTPPSTTTQVVLTKSVINDSPTQNQSVGNSTTTPLANETTTLPLPSVTSTTTIITPHEVVSSEIISPIVNTIPATSVKSSATSTTSTIKSTTSTIKSTTSTMKSTTSIIESTTFQIELTTSAAVTNAISFAIKPDKSILNENQNSIPASGNCIFLNNRGGYQCANWESPTLSRDLKEARMRKSNELRKFLDQYNPDFEVPLDFHFHRILERSFPAYTEEFLTLKIFTKCLNYHFHLFESKNRMGNRPMPMKKRAAESIITMMRMRDICGIPLTPIRKEIMLNSLWFFARNLRRNKTIGLAQYIIKACEDEVTVDPEIEEKFVNRALQRVLSKSAKVWSKNSNIFHGFKTATHIPDEQLAKMSPIIKEAVNSAMETDSDDLRVIVLNIMKASRKMMTKR